MIAQTLGGVAPTTATYAVDINAAVSPTVGTVYEIYIVCVTNSFPGTYVYLDIVYENVTDDS